MSLPEKPDSLWGLLLDLPSFAPNACLTTSMSLCLYPCQLMLCSCTCFPVLLLLGFLHCLAMPDTSSSLPVHGLSRIKNRSSPHLVESQKFLVLTVDWYQAPMCSTYSKALLTITWDSQQRRAHTWHISSRHLLLLLLWWSQDYQL